MYVQCLLHTMSAECRYIGVRVELGRNSYLFRRHVSLV
ncbi:hypothetical protein GBAR_LOCUS7243 [Geodia barretti]|uniref:Uncharacterized protein n=1 Tax=Geodia barretti TaxID=519541 RepID=A0AA35RI40_GEOBA|nr:hypothetical protein GBAR_LOCUS7243 [Geodia barretti]